MATNSCYASSDIHEIMLSDKARMHAYHDAIIGNKQLFKDKIVLDVGAGTGILSIWAVKAGAAHVHAVERASVIDAAKRIAENNGVSDKITFYEGNIKHVTLPGKVDIIVSEWMGYSLFFERMFDDVIWARNNCLAPEGMIFPDKAELFVFGVSEVAATGGKFWTNVWGINMTAMWYWSQENSIRLGTMKERHVATNFHQILSLDLSTCSPDWACSGPFQLTARPLSFWERTRGRSSVPIQAFGTYFTVKFTKGNETIELSTSPTDIPTHWGQTVFRLHEALMVRAGKDLNGEIKLEPAGHQGLRIIFTCSDSQDTFTFELLQSPALL